MYTSYFLYRSFVNPYTFVILKFVDLCIIVPNAAFCAIRFPDRKSLAAFDNDESVIEIAVLPETATHTQTHSSMFSRCTDFCHQSLGKN